MNTGFRETTETARAGTGLRYLLGLFCLLFGSLSHAEAPARVKALLPELLSLSADPILISAVREQNARKLGMDVILARDTLWLSKTLQSKRELEAPLLNSPAARRLLELEASQSYFFELFLSDNQGALVAATNRTSDYWQGDEDKWMQAYKQGQGSLYVSDIHYDDSVGFELVQISLPVMYDDMAIGVVTIGVNISDLESHRLR